MDKTQHLPTQVAAKSAEFRDNLPSYRDKVAQQAADRVAEQAAFDAKNANAFASSYDNDTIGGEALNFLGQAIEGGARIAGNVAGAYGGGIEAVNTQLGLSKDVTDAFNLLMEQRNTGRFTNTPELAKAQELLAQPFVHERDALAERADPYAKYRQNTNVAGSPKKGETNLDAIKRMLVARNQGRNVAKAVQDSVAGVANSTFTEDVRAGYKKLGETFAANLEQDSSRAGIAKALAAGVKDFAKETAANPVEALQLFGEQLPQFLANSNIVTGTVNSIGYANDVTLEALTYLEADGFLSDKGEVNQAVAAAGAAAAMDYVVDKSVVSGKSLTGQVTPKALQKAVNQAQSKAVEGVQKILGTTGTKTGLAIVDRVAHTGADMVKEAVTEGAQAILEEDVAKGKDGIDWANAAEQAAYGAASGGVMSGARGVVDTVKDAGQVVKEGAKAASATLQNRAEVRAEQADQEVAEAQAKKLAPEDRYVVGKDLDFSDVNSFDQAIDEALTDASNAQNTDRVRSYGAAAAYGLMKHVEDAYLQMNQGLNDPETLAQMSEEDQMQAIGVINKLKTIRDKYNDKVQAYSQAMGSDTLSKLAEEVQVGAAPEVAEDLVTETQRNPEQVTEEQLAQVLDSETSAISQPQRALLETHRALLQTTAAYKDSGKVNEDVIYGSKPGEAQFFGAKQYEGATLRAVAKGDTEAARQHVGNLQKFADRHDAKAQAVTLALSEAARTNESVTLPEYTQINSNKPLVIHPKSTALVAAIQGEAKYLQDMARHLSAYVDTASLPAEPVAQAEPAPGTEVQAEPVVEETVAPTPEPAVEPEAVNEPSPEPEPEPVSDEPVNQTKQLLSEAAGDRTLTEKTLTSNPDAVNQDFLSKNLVKENFGTKKEATVFQQTPDFVSQSETFTLEQVNAGRDKPYSADVLEGFRQLTAFGFRLKSALYDTFTAEKSDNQLDYRKATPILYLGNERGQLGNYVADALTVAAYNWVATSGKDTRLPDSTATVELLGLDESFEANRTVQEIARKVGVNRDAIIQSLGQEAFAVLGLTLKNDALPNVKANLITSLGVEAFQALLDAKVLVENRITQADLAGTALDGLVTIEGVGLASYQMADPKSDGLLQAMTTDAGKRNKALQEMVGSEFHKTYAVIGEDAKPFVTREFNNGAGQQVPLQNYINAAKASRRNKHYLNQNMHRAYLALGKDWFKEMLGWKPVDGQLAYDLPSVEGKNLTVEREMEKYEEFVDRMADEAGSNLFDTYFRYSIKFANQMRQMIQGRDINFQTSKFHRFMTNLEGVDIPFADADLMTKFMLSMGQAMGVGTDKLNALEGVKATRKVLEHPDFGTGVEAARKLVRGESLTDSDKAALMAATALGGEKTHSLKAVLAYAEMEEAKAQGRESFHHTLPYEIDGITNGAFNEALQFGLIGTVEQSMDALNKGGMFIDELVDYGDYISNKDNQDTYETVMQHMGYSLKAEMQSAPAWKQTQLQAFLALIGNVLDEDGKPTKAGRKFVKPFTTAAMYLSGKKAQGQKLVEVLIDNFYGEVRGALKTGNAAQFHTAVANLADLMEGDTGKRFIARTRNMTEAQVRDLLLTKAEQQALAKPVSFLNKHLTAGIDSVFGDIHLVAKEGSKLSNLVFALYEHAFTEEVKARTEALQAAGQLSKYAVLPPSEVAEIKKLLQPMAPIMNSYFTAGSNNLDEMLPLYKERGQRKAEKVYATHGVNALTKGNYFSEVRALEAPNAGYAPKANIANGDAATIGQLQANELPFLNTHDGITVQVNLLDKATQQANEAAFNATMNYDLVAETAEMGARALAAFEARYGSLDTVFTAEEDAAIHELPALIESQRYYGRKIHDNKAALKQRQILMSQFKGFGMGTLYQNGKPSLKSPSQEQVQASFSEVQAVALSVKPGQDLEVTLNKSTAPTPPPPPNRKGYKEDFAVLLDGVTTFVELQAATEDYLKANHPVLAHVFTQAAKRVDPFLPIKVLAPQDGFTVREGLHTSQTHGAFMGSFIYLNDGGHSNSGLNPETVVHEVVHAALYDVMTVPEASLTPAVRKARREVENLYRMVQTNPKMDMLHHGLADVHEFLAWGLTNKDFAQELAKLRNPLWATKVTKKLFALVKRLLGLTDHQGELDNALTKLFSESQRLFMAPRQGVSPETVALPQQANQNRVLQMDLVQLLDALPGNPQHHLHLRDVLRETVSKVVNPAMTRYRSPNMRLDAQTQLLMNRLDPEVKPSVSAVQFAEFRMTEQERLAFGLVSEVLQSGLNDFSLSKSQLEQAYKQAKAQLRPDDFLDEDVTETDPDYAESLRRAQKRYDLLFGLRSNVVPQEREGSFSPTKHTFYRSDVYRNFAALALTNAQVREVLNKVNLRPVNREASGLVQRLTQVFSELMGRLSGYLTRTENLGTTSQKIEKLAKNIIHQQVVAQTMVEKLYERATYPVNLTVNKLSSAIKLGLEKTKQTEFFQSAKAPIANAAVNLADVFSHDQRLRHFSRAMDNVLWSLHHGKQGFWASIVDEMRGTREGNERIHRLLPMANREIDHARQAIIQHAERELRGNFLTELSDKDDVALYKALGKTDAAWLVSQGLNMETLAELMSNPHRLRQAILDMELQVQQVSGTDQHFYLRQAKNLGYFMTTGKTDEHHTLLNAKAIALKHGTDMTPPGAQQVAAVTPMIESLASLYALHYTPTMYKTRAARVMRREAAVDSQINGVTFLMGMLDYHKKVSLQKSFKNGNETLMIKGYLKEQVNPHMSVRVAPEEEVALWQRQGYTVAAELTKDDKDPTPKALVLLVSDHGGDTAYLQGIASNLSLAMKGTSIKDMSRSGTYIGTTDVEAIKQANAANIAGMHHPRQTPMGFLKPTSFIPVLNASGDVVDYRYVMSEHLKDTLLEKNNSMVESLARSLGAVKEKENSEVVNRRLMEALKAQYEEDKANFNLDGYLFLSYDHADKHLRDTYRLLPDDARNYAEQLFGGRQIPVRKDLLNISFGYRKFSVKELWEEDSQAPKWVKNFITKVLDLVTGGRGHKIALKGERGLQELVRFVKDTVVIKSIVVMIDNMLSNSVELNRFYGVPLKDVFMQQYKAFKAANGYRKNEAELKSVELKLGMKHYRNQQERQALLQRQTELRDQQARNPVAPLIEEGLLQSIVEDVGQTDSRYAYRHSIEAKIRDTFNLGDHQIPQFIHEVLLTKQSNSYQALNSAVQLSDFASRYVLFKHLTEAKGMSQREAMKEAVEAFVNYDIPQHKLMQYGNDMGLLWFTKYYLRIQKVVFKAMRREPVRLMMLLMGQRYFDVDVAEPADSFMLENSPTNKVGFIDNIVRGLGSHPVHTLL